MKFKCRIGFHDWVYSIEKCDIYEFGEYLYSVDKQFKTCKCCNKKKQVSFI